MEEKIVKSHKEERTIKEVVIYPDHVKRKESEEFKKSKERLKEDGHFKCWVCGDTEHLEVHHFGCEWALEEDVDFDKLKELLEEFDPYGYGKLLKNKPLTSVDDIRNMLVLCEKHHRHPEEGIHETTFPIWIIQRLTKQGIEPIPEET
jgi:hypothetical protein